MGGLGAETLLHSLASSSREVRTWVIGALRRLGAEGELLAAEAEARLAGPGEGQLSPSRSRGPRGDSARPVSLVDLAARAP